MSFMDTRDHDNRASDRAAEERPLLVLPDVVFPGTVVQLELTGDDGASLFEHLAAEPKTLLAVFASRDGGARQDTPAQGLHPTGTLAAVASLGRKGRTPVLILQGVARATLEALAQQAPFRTAMVAKADEFESRDEEMAALVLSLREAVARVMASLGLPREAAAQIDAIADPGLLADVVASRSQATVSEKAELLGTLDVKARVRAVLGRVLRRAEVLSMRETIDAQVKGEMGRKQREHLLREQMKAIERELGEADGDGEDDLDALQKRIDEAGLPDEPRDVAVRQLKRLRSMQGASPEAAGVRTYLEWILDLPWTAATPDAGDVAAVRATLEADHHGLEKVKKRILEYLAVRKLKGDKKGPILCLIGPPGVGKTSLGKSIARAMGRKLHRVSLGGVHDEAAVRGHRRTYVGALPGAFIQGLKKVGVRNPVFVLDEVDKLGQDAFHGDPSAALLEVLDPEQNGTFVDHYLEIPYDLSDVLFIATANVADGIPAPLRDRMEVIEIPSYTRDEKLAIARSHLVPKQLSEHGLGADRLSLSDDAIRFVIDRYTREAGVRSLERRIGAIVRGVAVEVADGRQERAAVVTGDDVRALLGPAPHDEERAERTLEPGIATGLAWTPVGGQVLFVEATRMPGSGQLTLTGQLGDVMKESALAALSYVRANPRRWGIADDFFAKSDIHVHVPAGGMPKDGPSAGVTILSALVSLLSGVPVRGDVAMTGEITLRGRVLPIGGLKEKALAAHRAGYRRIIVPERNRADFEEVPADVRHELDVVFASNMGQVVDAALEHPPARLPALIERGPSPLAA